MKRSLAAAALTAALLAAGCGSGHPAKVTVKAAPVKVPASEAACAERHEMGCGIRLHFGIKVRATAPLLQGRGAFGVDVSQWQGWYPNLSGTRFVLIQSNYGGHIEPSVYEQVRDARNQGLPYGCYDFGEPGASGEGGERLAASLCRGAPLGVWYDAEVNGAYAQAFAFNRAAHDSGVRIHGTYTSPGLWPYSYAPSGYLWAAIWWSGGVYAYGGWSYSAIVVHQFCGTCDYHGIGDLDEDRGLLAAAHPTPPESPSRRHAREKRELAGHEAVLRQLRAQLAHLRHKLNRYGCARRRHDHQKLGPKCAGWYATGDRVSAHGRYEDAAIAKLKHALA